MKCKFCRRCKSSKVLGEFYSDRKSSDGCSTYCKSCTKKIRKEYYANNKEKVKAKTRKYKKENKEAIRHKNMLYRKKNKDKIRQWKLDNKEKIQKYRKEYLNIELSDINTRIAKNLRTRIWESIKNKGNKSKRMKELLGCSFDFFLIYLENQFDENMNWDNYGNYWHIDHIIPCCNFDLSDEKEQEKCFHYLNMRPLEAHENISRPRILETV